MGKRRVWLLAWALLPPLAQAVEVPPPDPAAGRQVAQDICAACHGLDGNAVIDEYPNLAGQNLAYLIDALIAYRENRRIGGNAGLMRPQAERLTPQQMADVAAYYSGLAGATP